LQARLKGALVTRLARPELCVINTHPVANYDGDWSEANRFYPLHRAELAVLARVVNEAGPRAVVCGDFNVSRESTLFGDFMAATGLADAFEGGCPPTFRAEYLPAGATPHCIDFILTASRGRVDGRAGGHGLQPSRHGPLRRAEPGNAAALHADQNADPHPRGPRAAQQTATLVIRRKPGAKYRSRPLAGIHT
jgi:hypothetical protein